MKIVKDNQNIEIGPLVDAARTRLQQAPYVISTMNPVEHIAAYVAWREVGGVIIVDNPLIPQTQRYEIIAKALSFGIADSLVLTTSGTTGTPTPYCYTMDHVRCSGDHFSEILKFTPDTNFLCMLPPTLAIFWLMMLGPWYEKQFTLTLSSMQTLGRDLRCGADTSFLPPVVFDVLSGSPDTPLKKIKTICTGGTTVTQRHVRSALELGAERIVVGYAATEVARMLLWADVTDWTQYNEWFNLNSMPSDIKHQFNEDGELIIQCATLPANYSGTELNMRDVFERSGDMVRFKGRTRELCKVNGQTISLFDVEDAVIKITGVSDCLVRVARKGFTEYLECLYEGDVPDGYDFKRVLREHIAKHEVPLKYTKTTLERTAMGKKVRRI